MIFQIGLAPFFLWYVLAIGAGSHTRIRVGDMAAYLWR